VSVGKSKLSRKSLLAGHRKL